MNVAIAIFAFLAIILTIRIFRKNQISTLLFLMWFFIWFALLFFSLFPSVFNDLSEMLNVGNRLMFFIVGAIIILYTIIFQISSGISKTNKKISKLAQEIAILKYKLEEKDNTKNNDKK